MQKRFTELTVLLNFSCEVDGRNFSCFLLQLAQEGFASLVEASQFFLSVLQLAQKLRLVAGEVADAVMQANQYVDYPQEYHPLPVLQLRKLHGPVEGLELGDLLAYSRQLSQFLL